MNDALPPNPPVASELPSPHPPRGPQPEFRAEDGGVPRAMDEAGDLPPIPDPYLDPSAASGRLDDPFLYVPLAPPPARLSKLAITSLVAPLLLGPVGALGGIVFGWSARRAIEASRGRKRGYAVATAGMVLGIVAAMTWGALLSLWLWTRPYRMDLVSFETDDPPRLTEPRVRRAPVPSAAPDPAKPDMPASGFLVPKTTTSRHEGAITLVDVGVSATSLKEALAKERALAASAGETMVVMTTGSRCEPCQGVDASLRDPLMQTALSHARLVRVDVHSFQEDLSALKIPSERIPGFYLLALDLTPRDGIDGGEWDDDVARNIAPVLGAFVRGKYSARREAWKPLPGSGMRL